MKKNINKQFSGKHIGWETRRLDVRAHESKRSMHAMEWRPWPMAMKSLWSGMDDTFCLDKPIPMWIGVELDGYRRNLFIHFTPQSRWDEMGLSTKNCI